MKIHPLVLLWLLQAALDETLRPVYLAGHTPDGETFTSFVSRTDCYPCCVEWTDEYLVVFFRSDMEEEEL